MNRARCFFPAWAVLLTALAWPTAQASSTQPCPIPDSLRLSDLTLPRAQAGMAKEHKLIILTVGGAATSGQAAGDPAATYPARLEAMLRAAMPNTNIQVVNKASLPRGSLATLPRLGSMIKDTGARLVIWATGAWEAAHSVETEDYINSLQSGIAQIHNAGADVILMDPQYAPSIARITNTEPYRAALYGTAVANDVPFLPRYELMMHWNDEGVMNLDAQDKQERQNVARHLFTCIATALAPAIVKAMK